jgi:hypothetical protein
MTKPTKWKLGFISNLGKWAEQAAWASRKYRGHRAMPATLMEDLLKAKI